MLEDCPLCFVNSKKHVTDHVCAMVQFLFNKEKKKEWKKGKGREGKERKGKERKKERTTCLNMG